MVRDFKELRVYQTAYEAAMAIFEESKTWPDLEQFSLTDQIRRSSRSVCANLAEAWGKRRYQRHFINKISDAESEAAETTVWLDFAYDAGYLNEDQREKLLSSYRQVRGGLVKMMHTPEAWCGPSNLAKEPESTYGPSG